MALRVTVELLPSWGGPIEPLGRLSIINTGDHPLRPQRGNYRIALVRDGRPNSYGDVLDWPRDRDAWELVAAALGAVKVDS